MPVFLEATIEFYIKYKKKIALSASGVAFLILLFFIVIGQFILEGMKVSLDAFLVSGGVI
ncbi:MarC family protein [Winogradskyella sp. Asnod2-B02-A]|uniref:MarC family protein n=1 Tax=Winogradskyella sp. Asnod2-B02-A TaxID=3160583 RepID=UPI00386E999E